MSKDEVPRQLGAILDVLGLHREVLSKEGREAGKDRNEVVGWLYRVLDTLDDKTGRLLGFTALLLAAQTFLARVVVEKDHSWHHLISFAVLFLLLFPWLTGLMGLRVFAVEWRFFGHVRGPEKPKTERFVSLFHGLFQTKLEEERKREMQQKKKELSSIEFEMWELADVCDKRVDANWRSFRWCLVSALSFLATIVFAACVVAN